MRRRPVRLLLLWLSIAVGPPVCSAATAQCDCSHLENAVSGPQPKCDCDCGNVDEPVMVGLRVDGHDSVNAFDVPGTVIVQPFVEVKVRIFGINLLKVQTVLLTQSETECLDNSLATPSQEFRPFDPESFSFSVVFDQDVSVYYVCFVWSVPGMSPSNHSIPADEAVHQGSKEFQRIAVVGRAKSYYMPLPLQVTVLVVLLALSGLFSGLNLGLMSLNQTELHIIRKCGDKQERKYAERIYPIRKRGNYLLCSLLLGNVLVNSAISILFDDLTSGLVALAISSIGIVIFGEIVPQAVCSRYGLAVGAQTVVLTKFFMVVTAPLSWPISKILDKCLGKEVGQVYNKDRLLELIRLSKEQETELANCQEVKIVTGALELGRKRVGDVMTDIKDVFMVSSDMTLTPSAVSAIVKSGYTRIPVYECTDRDQIVGILNVKDLALLDPDDELPLKTICKFYQHPVRFVMEDMPLSLMLDEFKEGHYHMALVQRIVDDGVNDPVYDVVGLITLEDIIEEIIQAEIMDEFDVLRETRRKLRRRRSVFVGEHVAPDLVLYPDLEGFTVSPQMSLAAYQYLSTTFDAFKEQFLSKRVFIKMMNQAVLHVAAPDQYEAPRMLYERDQPSDTFLLILEGKADVAVGNSQLLFDARPFHHFGYEVLQAIVSSADVTDWINLALHSDLFPMQQTVLDGAKFVPDFSLRITSDLVFFRVTAAQYLNAIRATVLERGVQRSRSLAVDRRGSCSSSNNSVAWVPVVTSGQQLSGGAPSSSCGSAQCSPTALSRSTPNVDRQQDR